jgi:hypothetical protein
MFRAKTSPTNHITGICWVGFSAKEEIASIRNTNLWTELMVGRKTAVSPARASVFNLEQSDEH